MVRCLGSGDVIGVLVRVGSLVAVLVWFSVLVDSVALATVPVRRGMLIAEGGTELVTMGIAVGLEQPPIVSAATSRTHV